VPHSSVAEPSFDLVQQQMSEALEIWDKSGVFLNLKDILAVMPSRALKSKWTVSPCLNGDEEMIDVLTKDENVLEEFAASGERMTFLRLQAVAESVDQVIWGVFKGFDGAGGVEPWIVITAFDSSYWRVDTQDKVVRRRIEGSFQDVRRRPAA
jgi:hypothetical protein